MAPAVQERRTPWVIIAMAGLVTIIAVLSVIIMTGISHGGSDRGSEGGDVHANRTRISSFDVPVVGSSLPTGDSWDGGGLVGNADSWQGTDQEEGAPVEDSRQCTRCAKTCEIFSTSSTLCCNVKCRTDCPQTMLVIGCEPLRSATSVGAGLLGADDPGASIECDRCESSCKFFGSSCCLDSCARRTSREPAGHERVRALRGYPR